MIPRWFCMVAALALFLACNSGQRPATGDQDADSPDITAETDDNTPGLDGDTTEEADETPDSDPDAEEAEAAEPEADEGEEELDGDPEPDPELDLDPEVEEETEWEETPLEPGVIAMDELPWPGLIVTACNETMNIDGSLAQSRAVWGDDAGVVYFGGDAFWVLDETNTPGTLTCDTAMPHPMYSMDGRVTATGNELWTGHEGRIGRFVGGSWSFLDLPAEMLKGSEVVADDRVLDIDIAGEKISVLTKVKLGLYTPASNQWQVVAGCPEGVNRDYGLDYDGAKLWLSAGVKLYSVDLQTTQVQEEVTVVEEPRGDQRVGITGADENGVWMSVYGDRSHSSLLWDSILLLDSASQLQEYAAPVDGETDYHITGSNAVAPGSGGIPILAYLFETNRYYNPSCPYSPGPFLLANVSEIYAKLGLSPSSGSWTNFSPRGYLCYICSPIEFQPCMSLQMEMQSGVRAAAWRGTGQMWHLYERPRRYQWLQE